MLIKVCRTGKERYAISVPDNATVEALKRVIEQQEKIPVAEQNLTFNELFLEDDKLISEYGLCDNCTVFLYFRLGFKPTFTLNILLPARKKLILDMSGEGTVSELKKRIESKIGLKLATAELIYDHWVLEDDRKLMEYDIEDGSTILLAHELRAGPSLELRDPTHIRHAQPMPQSKTPRRGCRTCESLSDTNGPTGDVGEDEEDGFQRNLITVIFLPKTGSPIALKVQPTATLGEIRSKLTQRLRVPTGSVWFVRDGKVLDPTKTFAHYGISHGESVCLLSEDCGEDSLRYRRSSEEEGEEEEAGEKKVRITVHSKTGQIFICRVLPSTKIGALKRRLESEVGVSRTKIALFYQHKILNDEALVSDYGLSDGAVLYLRC